MKRLFKENISEFASIIGAPILYLWSKKFITTKDITFEAKALILSTIMIMPLFALIRIINNLEKYTSKKIIKYILNVVQFVLYAPILLVLLKTINDISEIFIIEIFSSILLTIPGVITLMLILLLFGIVSMFVEILYEKSH